MKPSPRTIVLIMGLVLILFGVFVVFMFQKTAFDAKRSSDSARLERLDSVNVRTAELDSIFRQATHVTDSLFERLNQTDLNSDYTRRADDLRKAWSAVYMGTQAMETARYYAREGYLLSDVSYEIRLGEFMQRYYAFRRDVDDVNRELALYKTLPAPITKRTIKDDGGCDPNADFSKE